MTIKDSRFETDRTKQRLNNSPTLGDVLEGGPGSQATLDLPVMPKSSERVGHRVVRQGRVKTGRKNELKSKIQSLNNLNLRFGIS